MRKSEYILFSILVMVVLFMCTSIADAANFKLKKKAVLTTPQALSGKPDLVVKKAVWSSNPRVGDTVGASSILNIAVLNRGAAPAGANRLKITCLAASGGTCPSILQGMKNIPPLAPGKSMGFPWPNLSSEKWVPGRYTLVLEVDPSPGKVDESRENNNRKTIVFTVLKKNHLMKKLKPVQKKQFHILQDLKVLTVGMPPIPPVAGENIAFTCVVKNSGKAKTPAVEASMEFWDTTPGANYSGHRFFKTVPDIPSLKPGDTYAFIIHARFIMFGDNAALRLKIDRYNKLRETNEKNNEKTYNFHVRCKPDLAFDHGMKANPGQSLRLDAKVGKPCKFLFNFYNNGWCKSKKGKISITGEGIDPLLLDLFEIKPCNEPHGIAGYNITLKWDTPGIKHCTMKIDSTNTNNESIESNNVRELIVNVKP